jgi:hypothetical protein
MFVSNIYYSIKIKFNNKSIKSVGSHVITFSFVYKYMYEFWQTQNDAVIIIWKQRSTHKVLVLISYYVENGNISWQ